MATAAKNGRRWLAQALALALTSAACGPPGQDDNTVPDYPGRAAVNWTLNNAPLTAMTCTSERISSMNVFIASRQNRDDNVEFLNVSCNLDRYSMAMVPLGPVRIFVDAVRETSQGQCVRYSGQVDTNATTQFPASPTPLVLRFVGNCP